MRVVPHLLCSMGNTSYADSQRQAAVTLAVSNAHASIEMLTHSFTHL